MPSTAMRLYRDGDRAAVIAALGALQDYEASLHDSRLTGAAVAEAYFEAMLAILARHSGALFVAEQDGRFAGFVACCVNEDDVLQETADSSRYGYIKDIFVMPERRGSGLVQSLLAAAERHLAPTGVTRVRIGVLAANRIACRAYEKHGFEPYEIVYEKRLVPSVAVKSGVPA